MPDDAVLKGISRTDYLRMHDRTDELDQAVASALADRKEYLAEVKAKIGGPDDFAAFKRVRKDREMAGASRQRREVSYRHQMSFLDMLDHAAHRPQPGTSTEVVYLNAAALKRADKMGKDAGSGGRKRDENPYIPGTEAATRWDAAWLTGQATIAESMADEPPRRRGRPPGSRNRQYADPPSAPAADGPRYADPNEPPLPMAAEDGEGPVGSLH